MNISRDFGPLFIAVLIVLTSAVDLKSEELVVRGFSIPSGAMLPTLEIGDKISVDLKAYEQNDPARGDVVVFQKPEKNVFFVFRIMGLPNEKIQMRKGLVFVNGAAIQQIENGKYKNDLAKPVPKYREVIEDGKSYEVLDINPNSLGDNTREFDILPGHYFLMGDNRDNSSDSRFENGLVSRENILGRVFQIYFSDDHTRIGTLF